MSRMILGIQANDNKRDGDPRVAQVFMVLAFEEAMTSLIRIFTSHRSGILCGTCKRALELF